MQFKHLKQFTISISLQVIKIDNLLPTLNWFFIWLVMYYKLNNRRPIVTLYHYKQC